MKNISLCIALLSSVVVMAAESFNEPAFQSTHWGFRPAEGEVSNITPTPFVWKEQKNAESYEVEVAVDRKFHHVIAQAQRKLNVWCPSRTFDTGEYFWRVRFIDREKNHSKWSTLRKFSIAPNAVPNPMPEASELWKRVPKTHPRLFVRPEEMTELCKALSVEQKNEYFTHCDKYLTAPPDTSEVPKYPSGVKRPSREWQKIWWGNRIKTMTTLDAAAELGFAHRLGGKAEYGELGKKILLECAQWDPTGASSMNYNDEVGMPYLSRFSRAYSYLNDLLSEEDKAICRRVIAIRGEEAFAIFPRHFFQPYNSHHNRRWHFLGEAAIVFFGEIPEAEKWLDHAMNVYFCVYPIWGDDDGGWHEGLWYWREYIERFLWWAEIMDNTFAINICAKPFFLNTGYFPMYVLVPGTRDGGFGDLAHLNRKQHALLMKKLSALSKNEYWQWYADQIAPASKESAYLELLRRYRQSFMPKAKAPLDLPKARVFRGTGLAALNSSLIEAKNNVQILFKSSPRGTHSHGYDANNSFLLNAFGERLLIRSGQRDMYGSNFHSNWMWETKSQNNITVNGKGQVKRSADAKGEISAFIDQEEFAYVRGNAVNSYPEVLSRYDREIFFLRPSLILVIDCLTALEGAQFNYHLHAINSFLLKGQHEIVVENGDAACKVQLIIPLNLSWTLVDKFDPPPLPSSNGKTLVQSHLTFNTPGKSTEMQFISVIRPYRKSKTQELQKVKFSERDGIYFLDIALPEGYFEAKILKNGFLNSATLNGKEIFKQKK